MDDIDLMARSRRRVERIEPPVRRPSRAAELDIGLTETDRPGRSGGGRRGAGKPVRGRAAPARKRTRRKPKRGIVRRTLRIIGLMALVVVVAGGALVAYYGSKLPSITSWAVPERPPNIQIVAADGTVIANRGDTGGESVTLEELPPYVYQAIVAIEDRRFYGHIGVDPIGLARVVVDAITSGDRMTGASTLTQQLARTLFLTMDRTPERKIQEAILAVWLEIQYSKDDILEMYLNRVYFGAGAYGIDAAARRYFGKPASRVTLAEAAILAGILPRPSAYAPTVNMEVARTRQQLVLNAMVEQGYITEREADFAKEAEIVTVSASPASNSGSYVADWVADLVPSYIGAIPGDIRVDTTIDVITQAMAAEALRSQLDENGAALGVTQGAIVAMTPDGAVRALVGGRSYAESQFNRAVTARRQPGSSFKPFVYLTALEHGLRPETIRIDQPVTINGWSPENYSEEYLGPVSLQRALALSLNTISVQLTAEVGPAAVVATARRLGITSELQPHPSIALGTSEVSLLEMTGAYAPFANGGVGVIPHVIRRITTEDGEVLYERSGSGPGVVVQPQYVGMMNAMLQETLATGTARRATIDGRPAAGKTGTSQDWRDAWFIGYTANLVTGVWVGNDDNSPTDRASGGNLPTQIWSAFMTPAHQGLAVAALPGNYSFRDPNAFAAGAAPPQTISEIITGEGRYDEYLGTYVPMPANSATPPAGYQGNPEAYNPAYDPRYDPTVPQQYIPPAPIGQPQPLYPQGTVAPQGQQYVAPPAPPAQQQLDRPGLLRRIFGN